MFLDMFLLKNLYNLYKMCVYIVIKQFLTPWNFIISLVVKNLEHD